MENYSSHEIMCEILSWMPAKAVIKLACLLYNTLLSQPHFLRKQTINSSTSNGGFFIRSDRFTSEVPNYDLTFHDLPIENPKIFSIPNDCMAYLKQQTWVLTSNQGLLIINDLFNHQICICNRVTKTLAPIPYSTNVKYIRHLTNGFVLCFAPCNTDFPKDYTLIATVFIDIPDDPWTYGPHLAVYLNGKWAEETCSLRGKLREVRDHQSVGLFTGPNHGLVVHFLFYTLTNVARNPVYLEPYVAAYDIETMSLWTKAKLPKGAWVHNEGHQVLDIFDSGESLGLVRTDGSWPIVWVLETYTPVRWRMVVDKTVMDMGVPDGEGGVHGCCVVNGKGLMFATLNQVYLYEIDGGNTGRLKVIGQHSLRDEDDVF